MFYAHNYSFMGEKQCGANAVDLVSPLERGGRQVAWGAAGTSEVRASEKQSTD